MGFLDRLRGRPAEPADDEPAPAPAPAAAPPPRVDLTEAPPPPGAADAGALYNPYAGLGVALDRRGEGGRPPAFRLPREPEFLFAEDAAAAAARRSWSENLTYYTGAGYLAGAAAGGSAGAWRAMGGPPGLPDAAASRRLRVNALLNSSGRLGRSAGNALGVAGLLFASGESLLRHLADGAVPDAVPTLAAGAATGAVYRSVRGPRQAAAAAAVGALAAGALLAGRSFVNPGL
jgi:import inner membrane translocase subunit TIM23